MLEDGPPAIEEGGEEDVACSVTYFTEKEECLEVVIDGCSRAHRGERFDMEEHFQRLKKILDKYQEQSQLLDPHLEDLLSPPMATLKAMAREGSPLLGVSFVGKVLNAFVTVRGYKTVSNFMSHEPADVELAEALLARLDEAGDELPTGFVDPVTTWEARRVVMLWLSVLVLIPFDLATVDSGSAGVAAPAAGGALASRLGGAASRCLAQPGGVRETAAVLLGRLLTRPDAAGDLRAFLAWAEGQLTAPCEAGAGGAAEEARRLFLVPGVAHTLACLLKSGQRRTLLPLVPTLWPLALLVSEHAAQSSNVLARKLAVKLAQRVAMVLLSPLADSRGAGLHVGRLEHTLGNGGDVGAGPSEGSEKKGEQGTGVGADDGEAFVLAEEVEDIVQLLLQGLTDRDTVVRWSSAKGVGRVAARLPGALAGQVADEVQLLMSEGETDTAWHGACLALAELARRGLLDPCRLEAVAPLVERALHYDVRRGPHSVGVHVRDAAAYVCWAFARAYPPAAMAPFVATLAPALLTVACFDREVICRRAASAAFQECVGRLGNFPHGIAIVTAADFFSLATRANAYLTVAPTVAAFDPYHRPLATHLLHTKLAHWDPAVRDVAARALAALAPRDPAWYAIDAVDALVPRTLDAVLEARHGAALGLAALLPALDAAGATLGQERAGRVAGVVPAVEKARLYRGKGGELMRGAVCRLVGGMAAARIELPLAVRRQVMDSLDENLRHPNASIQQAAAEAVGAFTRAYMPEGTANQVQRTAQRYVPWLGDANPAVRRGAALALGRLPGALLQPALGEVLEGLARAVEVEESAEDRVAEARANAAGALREVAREALAGNGASALGPLLGTVLPALLRGCEDFSVDKRGDVGSWVREAAMRGAGEVLAMAAEAADGDGDEDRAAVSGAAERVVAALLRQSVERLGKLREAAGRHLLGVQALGAARPWLSPGAVAAARATAPGPEAVAGLAEASPEALAGALSLLREEAWGPAVMEGVVASAGGVDFQLASAVGDAVAWHVEAGGEGAARRVLALLVRCWRRHARSPRLATPLLKTTEALFARGCVGPATLEREEHAADLLALVRDECRGCKDVPRLLAAASCLSNLAGASGPVRRGALTALLNMTGSRFPKVRRTAAELLYVRLLTTPADALREEGFPVTDEGMDGAQDTLVSNAWDGPMEHLEAPRAALYACLGIEAPAKGTRAGALPAKGAGPDEESYRILVEDAARGL